MSSRPSNLPVTTDEREVSQFDSSAVLAHQGRVHLVGMDAQTTAVQNMGVYWA